MPARDYHPMQSKFLFPHAVTCALLILFSSVTSAETDRECVVLLHGLFRSSVAMKPLEWHLESQGYTVVNQDYASISFPIEELAEVAVGQGIDACQAQGIFPIHFVTHSLGGLLVRQYAGQHAMPESTRVVMLGPPNQGSQVADYYGSFTFLGDLEPVAIDQLGTGEQSLARQLGPVEFQLGVIAGNIRSGTFLPGFPDEPSDGTVTVAETIVPGMLDFLQMPVVHTFMIWNPMVWSQAVHFLRDGQFQR